MYRREFVAQASLLLTASAVRALPPPPERELRIGLCADVHYADADARGTRHYRLSLGRLRAAAAEWNRQRVDVVVELGDFIDTGPKPDAAVELEFLRTVEREFRRARASRHHVLGNHCVATLTKRRFLDAVGQKRAHYSFDRQGVHCVVLDACYRADGAPYGDAPFDWTDCDIPAHQRTWLADDLARTKLKTVVFVHQRLDLPVGHHYAIRSSPEVRGILEASGKVAAVVMGHSHKNELNRIEGIAYVTLAAMVEGPEASGNAYSILKVMPDGRLGFSGFGRHSEHPLSSSVG